MQEEVLVVLVVTLIRPPPQEAEAKEEPHRRVRLKVGAGVERATRANLLRPKRKAKETRRSQSRKTRSTKPRWAS